MKLIKNLLAKLRRPTTVGSGAWLGINQSKHDEYREKANNITLRGKPKASPDGSGLIPNNNGVSDIPFEIYSDEKGWCEIWLQDTGEWRCVIFGDCSNLLKDEPNPKDIVACVIKEVVTRLMPNVES